LNHTAAAATYSLGHGLRTFTAVSRSTHTQWDGKTSGVIIRNGDGDVDDSMQPTGGFTAQVASRLAWSEGWQPSGAQSAFIK